MGLGVAILILTLLYHFMPKAGNTIIFLGSGIGVAATVIAAALSFEELRGVANHYELSVEQHKQAIAHDRQAVAFLYMEKFGALPIGDAASALEDVKSKTPEQIDEYLRSNPQAKGALVKVFNCFEEMALAAQFTYADEATLCALLEEPVVRY